MALTPRVATEIHLVAKRVVRIPLEFCLVSQRFSPTNYASCHDQSINVILAHDLYWEGTDSFK